MIQKRTMIFVSDHDFSSKWWCSGAIRKIRFRHQRNEITWSITERASITKMPPTSRSSSGTCRKIAIVPIALLGFGLVMLFVKCPHGFPPYWWLAGWSMITGLGMGVAAPATNNATLQLAPDQVAQIAGLRGTFRQSGGILYVSLATALLARSANAGVTQSHFFLLQAAVLMVMISLVFLVFVVAEVAL